VGSCAATLTVITASTTLTNTTTSVLANASSAITITIPAATSCSGRFYHLKNMSGNSVSIVSSGGDIEGSSSPYSLSTKFQSITLQSDGNNWWIMN